MSDPVDDRPDLVSNGITSDTLSFSLNRFAHIYSRPFRADIGKRAGVSTHEWRVIVVLATRLELNAVRIARETGLLPMSISRAVSHLRSMGLVEGRPNPADLRSTVLSLTAKGKTVYNDIAPQVKERTEFIFRDLSADDQRRMADYVDKLTRRALLIFGSADEMAGDGES